MRNKVSIMNALSALYDNIGSENTDDTPTLLDWAIKADELIGSFYDYTEKIKVLSIKHCKVQLPQGVKDIRGLLVGDHGCDCGLIFDRASLVFKDTSTDIETTGGLIAILVTDTGDLRCYSTKWYVENNVIVLNKDLDGEKVTVKLLMYHLDKNGLPLVNADHIEAIAAYLEYKLANRSRWSKNQKERLSNVDIRELKETWENKCLQAFGDSNYPSDTEKEEVAQIMNNPLSGRGINIPGDQ